jgi:lipase
MDRPVSDAPPADASRPAATVDVTVPGGDLRVAVWDGPSGAPVVLLIHGITSSHLAWQFVADRLPALRLIAPDLRGRGASSSVAGAAGLAQHADDLVAVLDRLGVERTLVVGHSMGAFVAVVLADRHPDRVSRLVLVDGGLPLDVPAGMAPDEIVARVLGPTAARLSMRFDTPADYLDFWREHPAFHRDWTPELERYLEYDLVETGSGSLRPATRYGTVVDDNVDMTSGDALPTALAGLRHPARLLTVPRGLQNESPGLYAPDYLDERLAERPGIRHERIDGYNHYTIVMSPSGADVVAAAVREEVDAV